MSLPIYSHFNKELIQVFVAITRFGAEKVFHLFSKYSHSNKELTQVFLAITRVWCRKSFPSLFEMTITIRPDQVKHGLLSKYLTDQLKHP